MPTTRPTSWLGVKVEVASATSKSAMAVIAA